MFAYSTCAQMMGHEVLPCTDGGRAGGGGGGQRTLLYMQLSKAESTANARSPLIFATMGCGFHRTSIVEKTTHWGTDGPPRG